jgi:hypothetical protein
MGTKKLFSYVQVANWSIFLPCSFVSFIFLSLFPSVLLIHLIGLLYSSGGWRLAYDYGDLGPILSDFMQSGCSVIGARFSQSFSGFPPLTIIPP